MNKTDKVTDKTLFIGIDCGKYGAISVTDIDGNILNMFDMPLLGYEVDIDELYYILGMYKTKDVRIVVEQMFPGFSEHNKQAIWQQAKNFQAVFCAIHHASLQYSYDVIIARTWQSKYINECADKKKSIAVALERTGRKDVFVKNKDGRAEAYLIGEYGREYMFTNK